MKISRTNPARPVPFALARPFVYIASLRRTGSTVLAEALTKPPSSFIFREPHLARNRFSLKDDDARTYARLGIDLAAMREEWLATRRKRHVLERFRDEFLPRAERHFEQIGVKEIRHENWRAYLEAFPGMKVIITGRDPRDIYISLYHRQRAGMGSWKGDYTPPAVADDLLEHFTLQLEIASETDCLRVRYEDLCSDPAVFDRIRQHVDSPLPDVGEIGIFLGSAESRRIEDEIHGGSITDKRAARWKTEKDARLVEEAHQCFDLMREYTRFWNYAR